MRGDVRCDARAMRDARRPFVCATLPCPSAVSIPASLLPAFPAFYSTRYVYLHRSKPSGADSHVRGAYPRPDGYGRLKSKVSRPG